jgi:hypothetical protein
MERTLKTGIEAIDQPVNFINSRGEKVPSNVSTAVLREDDGCVLGAVGTFRDVVLGGVFATRAPSRPIPSACRQCDCRVSRALSLSKVAPGRYPPERKSMPNGCNNA